ncbi:MAG: response regulator receiver protein [Myxococcales bacterium]|nr:response regulator receiver protein [Myxococcales bacterium]
MKRHRILVVEDDPPTLASIRDLFRRAGFEVDTATTGRDALGLLLDGELPSAVVLDSRMPVMGGEELVSIIRGYSRLAHLPVLVLTACDTAPAFARSVEAVMRKPFRAEDLIASVETLLTSRSPQSAP